MTRRERLPQVQRVAAYAVILRDEKILLSRLSDTLTATPQWTLPGGGLDHGEDPRAAVVREVREETGLDVTVGDTAWVLSAHSANTWRRGRNVNAHALRIVYDGWVPVDAPEPHTVEVGGSTAEAAWLPLADVLSGDIPTLPLVRDALTQHRVTQVQRVGVYGLLTRTLDGRTEVLLTRIAPHAVSGGKWHLPGGGIDFGESPREALVREFAEETGLKVEIGAPLEIRDVHFTGVAPHGRLEDFHGLHLIFTVTTSDTQEPVVVEVDGTTDQVAWVAISDVAGLDTTPQVTAALAASGRIAR
ncbi:NUDIX domain-containing protein [Nocardioides sp. Kera G14]|uniref:NUDIX domain-containing protein n=1 Tax=Nocardioides sp. Kera G14 TaxID=2884264 RepID=UPI001D11FE25|nr:NUDIX domain-containing protein [Nocardioides sp. Kera G14]UDY23980.1 NUDIX domain-containing protein [Nocardioides sp. Kera G14]